MLWSWGPGKRPGPFNSSKAPPFACQAASPGSSVKGETFEETNLAGCQVSSCHSEGAGGDRRISKYEMLRGAQHDKKTRKSRVGTAHRFVRTSLNEPYRILTENQKPQEWLGEEDSNLHRRLQRPLSCRWTIPQDG